MPRPSLPMQHCLEEAKKYDSRSAFSKGSKAAYATLHRRGLLDAACAHMLISPKYSDVRWDAASVFVEAAKYRSRSEFRRCNQGAYGFALKNGVLDQACSHMRDGQKCWHVFEMMAVALKYNDWGQFIQQEAQAYNYANKNKLTALASAHMSKSRKEWSKSSVMLEASKHRSRELFRIAASGAYKHATQYGYLDEACAHMVAPKYGFSKEIEANLYHLRITMPDGAMLYKIGITNRKPEDRIAGMGLYPGVTAEVLDAVRFESGRDARIAEKRLHRRFANSRYVGPPVMKNGNTELFTVAVLDSSTQGA